MKVKDWAENNLPFTYMTATKILRLLKWKGWIVDARREAAKTLEYPIGIELCDKLYKHWEETGKDADKPPFLTCATREC
jgi:hypothetical protein